jgi:hypothetical protein
MLIVPLYSDETLDAVPGLRARYSAWPECRICGLALPPWLGLPAASDLCPPCEDRLTVAGDVPASGVWSADDIET